LKPLATLDHPGIVRAFDAGQRGGFWFLAMELVDGADFSTLSRALGPLPPADACELVRQAGSRFNTPTNATSSIATSSPRQPHAHHRARRLVTGEGLDFGLAQLAHNENTEGELTISGELLGTVDYIAPEQIENPRNR